MAKSGTPLEKAFYAQKQRAKQRGVAWKLTFEEWLDVWESSGHLGKRGRERGKYCMARHGDCGPYKIGNVSIVSYSLNSSSVVYSSEERARRSKRMAGNTHGRFRAGIPHSDEARAKMSAAHKGIPTGRAWNRGLSTSAETKLKIARGVSEAWAKKRTQNAEA